MSDFYDRMAGFYHLIFRDWDDSIERQAEQLVDVIQERWGTAARTILDVSCGIGTQSIGLAKHGFDVTASDLSQGAISRAREEANRRSAPINFSACDMRRAYAHHQRQFDVVISADNSITHLLNDDELLVALRQIYECVRPGGGCLLTVRDYDREERGSGIFKPYGVREENERRYVIFQVWDFTEHIYGLTMYFVVDDRVSEQVSTQVMRTQYYAIGTEQLLELLQRAGFSSAERLDGRSYQPILVADRKA